QRSSPPGRRRHAVRHHPGRPRPVGPAAAHAEGQRRAVPEGTGRMTAAGIDWEELRAVAREAMTHAYAPYSDYRVGAAARVDDGAPASGGTVANASYGVGLRAECGLVSALHRAGGGGLTHATCVDGNGDLLVPCGRCRQLLYECGGTGLLLDTPEGILPLS